MTTRCPADTNARARPRPRAGEEGSQGQIYRPQLSVHSLSFLAPTWSKRGKPLVSGTILGTGANVEPNQRSGPLDRTSPYPDVVLVRWCSEPNSDSAFGPRSRGGLHQLLDAVLPQDPRMHPVRDGWCANGEMPHLLSLQTPGLTLGDARAFGHHTTLSNICSDDVKSCLRGDRCGPRARSGPLIHCFLHQEHREDQVRDQGSQPDDEDSQQPGLEAVDLQTAGDPGGDE